MWRLPRRRGEKGVSVRDEGHPAGDSVLVPAGIAFAFAVWTLWLHWPALVHGDTGLMSENPDAIVSAWTLDWARAGRMIGPWTWHINPPTGAIAAPGGGVTARLLIPVTMLLGPTTGHDVSIALILALGGLSIAWLVRELTGSWSLGALTAAAAMGQPALLRLVRSGTLEHLAFWPLPAAAAALLRGIRTGSRRWAALGGLLLSLLPTESGYATAYALILLPAALLPAGWAAWKNPRMGRTALLRVTLSACAAGAPILVASAVLFSRADMGQLQGFGHDVAQRNALHLQDWLDFSHHGGWNAGSHRSAGAYASPAMLGVLGALTLVGIRKSWPWLTVWVLATTLALGPGDANVRWLEALFGSPGRVAGWVVQHVSTASLAVFPFSHVRFPWRWTLLALIAATTGAALGLQRLHRLFGTPRPQRGLAVTAALLLGLGAATLSAHQAGYRQGLPRLELPTVAACQWIRAQPGEGAVLLLPTFRQPMDPGNGVFGRLGVTLTGLDWLWLQVQHGRAQNFMVETIPTLIPVGTPGPLVSRWIHEADHIAFQRFGGAHLSRARVQEWLRTDLPHQGTAALRKAGYRFILVDCTAYPGDWMRTLQLLLGEKNRSPLHFSDGAGLAVFDLEKAAPAGTRQPTPPPHEPGPPP